MVNPGERSATGENHVPLKKKNHTLEKEYEG